MPIRVLPPEIANKIAAGEVVERPASVVKELVENAIDAGASEIRIEIAQGGRKLIRVCDDGCGIAVEDVKVAFQRHATSKLNSVDELFRIETLGFRGEALASIASVSRLSLSTRAESEEAGTELRLEGGVQVHNAPQSRPTGTIVTVEDLFYNTPARLKFLRTDPTEAGHVARLATSYALAYPEMRFSLRNNGRRVLHTEGTGELGDALASIYGLDIVEQMIPIELQPASTQVWGYIGGPSLHRATRRDLTFFVNRRWIQDSSLTYAVGEAYRTLLPHRRHPLVVLHIDVPPDQVDVNIHPTKREVRFRERNRVFVAVQRAVRTTLMAGRPIPVMEPSRGSDLSRQRWGPASNGPGQAGPAFDQRQFGMQPPPNAGVNLAPGEASPQSFPQQQTAPGSRLPMLRVVGQVAQTYIIAEGPGGLYLIDQHAAHERIRYEALMASRVSQQAASQGLLEPLPIELDPQQATLLQESIDALNAYGFELMPFGGNTFLVKRIPANLRDEDILAALVEMVEAAREGGEGFSWHEQALITLSCHTAIRAGQTLSDAEMRDLLRQLEACALPHTCPHGRPTMIHLSEDQLARQFGRT